MIKKIVSLAVVAILSLGFVSLINAENAVYHTVTFDLGQFTGINEKDFKAQIIPDGGFIDTSVLPRYISSAEKNQYNVLQYYEFDILLTGGTSQPVTSDKVIIVEHLGAMGNPPPNINIVFDTDGGNVIEPQLGGGRIEKPQDPVKEGYIFNGWYFNRVINEQHLSYSPDTSYFSFEPWDFEWYLTHTNGNSDFILYASWLTDPTITTPTETSTFTSNTETSTSVVTFISSETNATADSTTSTPVNTTNLIVIEPPQTGVDEKNVTAFFVICVVSLISIGVLTRMKKSQ